MTIPPSRQPTSAAMVHGSKCARILLPVASWIRTSHKVAVAPMPPCSRADANAQPAHALHDAAEDRSRKAALSIARHTRRIAAPAIKARQRHCQSRSGAKPATTAAIPRPSRTRKRKTAISQVPKNRTRHGHLLRLIGEGRSTREGCSCCISIAKPAVPCKKPWPSRQVQVIPRPDPQLRGVEDQARNERRMMPNEPAADNRQGSLSLCGTGSNPGRCGA